MTMHRCISTISSAGWVFGLLLLLGGCAGVQTFPNMARPGDTVALAAGWKQQFARDQLAVTIADAGGGINHYPPGHPAIRAVVNLYPDPLSSVLVSDQTGQDLTFSAGTYANMVNINFTSGDQDWWQTTVFIDLPPGLATGPATVTIDNGLGASAVSTLEIIAGDGMPAVFNAELNGPLQSYQLAALERVAHYTVQFSGATLPHAIQIDLTHDPDATLGGSGGVHVVNPRGDLKSLAWSGDGDSLRVLLMPVREDILRSFADFKFYVAGGVSGLAPLALQAFDVQGNPVPGVSVEVTASN